MTEQEALLIIREIHFYYQNFEVTEARVKSWGRLLLPHDRTKVFNNLLNYVQENKFPPTISDLVKEAEKEQKRSAYLLESPKTEHDRTAKAEKLIQAIKGGSISLEDLKKWS